MSRPIRPMSGFNGAEPGGSEGRRTDKLASGHEASFNGAEPGGSEGQFGRLKYLSESVLQWGRARGLGGAE